MASLCLLFGDHSKLNNLVCMFVTWLSICKEPHKIICKRLVTTRKCTVVEAKKCHCHQQEAASFTYICTSTFYLIPQVSATDTVSNVITGVSQTADENTLQFSCLISRYSSRGPDPCTTLASHRCTHTHIHKLKPCLLTWKLADLLFMKRGWGHESPLPSRCIESLGLVLSSIQGRFWEKSRRWVNRLGL